MQSLEQASNAELLSSLTGLKPAQLLMERFGGLSPLARASFTRLIKSADTAPSSFSAAGANAGDSTTQVDVPRWCTPISTSFGSTMSGQYPLANKRSSAAGWVMPLMLMPCSASG